MTLIKLEKIDSLIGITEKLRIVSYLQTLIQDDILANGISGFEENVKGARLYLVEQNEQLTKELTELVFADDFTVS